MQPSVQEAERVPRGRSMHLLIHIVCSRSHWLQQSLSRGFRVEQLKVKTLSKKIKTSKSYRFLFNLRSFHFGLWLPSQTHWLCRSLFSWLFVYQTLIHSGFQRGIRCPIQLKVAFTCYRQTGRCDLVNTEKSGL